MSHLYLLSLLVIALLQLNFHLVRALPMHEKDSSELHALTRNRRRAGHLNGSPALEYMKEIQSNITDQEGYLKDFNFSTSVWCMMDRDITEKNYRPSPKKSKVENKCERFSRYVFDMESISNSISTRSFPLAKSCFRPYLQTINRFMNEDGSPLPVNLSISMRFISTEDEASLSNITVGMSGSDFHLTTINTTRGSNHWLELEVTEALEHIWPPAESTSLLEIVLKMSIDCNQGKGKVPVTFVNPAEVELTLKKRRVRHETFQPLFLVYIEDSRVKERIQPPPPPPPPQPIITVFDIADEVGSAEEEESSGSTSGELVQERKKRNVQKDSNKCSVHDFTVKFHDLKLDSISEPREVNIRQCMGSCNHAALKTNSKLSTNHAKLMASAHELHRTMGYRDPNSQMYLQTPEVPCCVPDSYIALPLIIDHGTSVEVSTFPEFIVSSCKCR